MIGWLLVLALSFVSPAHAQCNGIFNANQACGSVNGGPPTQVPFSTIAGGGTNLVYSATQNGWLCDSTDRSTQALALLNTVVNAGGGTIFFQPCPVAYFIASSSGTNLTVSSMTSGKLHAGMILAGNGVPNAGNNNSFIHIVSQTSGTTGGAGVYVTSAATTASGDVMFAADVYKATQQLNIPSLAAGSGNVNGGPSIRFTGSGAGFGNHQFSDGTPAANNAAIIDLEYQGVAMSGVGFTVSGGSGYTSGSLQQTLTLSGGAGPLATLGSITAGTGGTPGTYNNVPLTGGTGSGAQATVVVGGGGGVSSVTLSKNGYGYLPNDSLSAASANIGSTSGFSVPVSTVTFQMTCTTAPQWQVVVSGGVVQNGQQSSIAPAASNGSIKVTRAGSCTTVPANPVTVTSTDSGTGATFNVYWINGKLQALGTGPVEIDRVSLIDAGSSGSTAMIYGTTPTIRVHDMNILCSGNATQDAIVFGGLLNTSQLLTGGADGPYLGYGSTVERVQTSACNRSVFSRSLSNEVHVTNLIGGPTSGDRFIEFLSGASGTAIGAVRVDHSYAEPGNNIRYGIVLNGVASSVFDHNLVFDSALAPAFVAHYYQANEAQLSSDNNKFILSEDGSAQFASYNSNQCGSVLGDSVVIGQMKNAFSGSVNCLAASKNTVGSLIGPNAMVNEQYSSSNFPPGGLSVTDQSSVLWMAIDTNTSRAIIDSGFSLVSGANPLVLNPAGASIAFNQYANASSTGTTNNKLAKLTGAPSTVVITTAGDTVPVVGIVVAGAGTTGNAALATDGLAFCVFDGATTAGHWVQTSAGTNGDCTDSGGTTYPTSGGWVIGHVTSTNGGAGTYQVAMQMGPTISGSGACANTATTINCTLSGGTSKLDFGATTSNQWTITGTANFSGSLNWPNVGILFASNGSAVLDYNDTNSGAWTIASGVPLFHLGIVSDATKTDSTVCQDTTTHEIYRGTGAAGICLGTSSLRFKHDVAELDVGLKQLMALEPISYKLNADHGGGDKTLYGFSAEQGGAALPQLVGKDAEGKPNTFDYMGVVPVLVKALQEQQKEIEELKRRLK